MGWGGVGAGQCAGVRVSCLRGVGCPAGGGCALVVRWYRRAAVPRDWSELFITDEAAGAESPSLSAGVLPPPAENLSKTRQALAGEIHATLFQRLDQQTWERLEEALIMADVGARRPRRSCRRSKARRSRAG